MESVNTTIRQFGVIANVSALISLLMCFSQSGIALLLSTLSTPSSESTDSSHHVQAVLMCGFAIIAMLGLYRDRHRHGDMLPLAIGIIGLVLMIGTLYGYYHWMILTFAYMCLIAAIFVNQNMALKSLNKKILQQAVELENWNKTLQQRVADELAKNQRLEQLKRFLSPQIAEIVISEGNEGMLASHRGQIAVVFCDLRGFTEFSDAIEPEEVMEVLRQYHEELGKLVVRFNGTIHHRAGDGLMVIFNDPVPITDPVQTAIKMALAMRECMHELLNDWRHKGYKLGFGVGIDYGYATLGIVGHEERYDYTANGNTVNLASRLCDVAEDGQILLSHKAFITVESIVNSEKIEHIDIKGFREPLDAYNIISLAD